MEVYEVRGGDVVGRFVPSVSGFLGSQSWSEG